MKRWGIVGIILLCIVLTSFISCNPFGGDAGKVGQHLVKVVRSDLVVTVSGTGTVEVLNDRKFAFSSGGRIERMYVDEGDKVDKGDALAKLDTSALELALTQAKVGLVQARVARDEAEYNLNQLKDVLHASYDRVKVAESAFNAAEEQIEAAGQTVAEAQKQLDEATINAPFDGVVARIDADEGDIVSAGTTIVYLIDPTILELKAEVDEIDMPGVKLGQRAIIDVDALPGVQFQGEVTSIPPLSIETAGVVVYEVKIGIDVLKDYELKPGMSASADILIVERNNVLLVPSQAVIQDSQGNPVVQVAVNEQIEERPIVIGISDGVETEVLGGLDEGEMVVVKE